MQQDAAKQLLEQAQAAGSGPGLGSLTDQMPAWMPPAAIMVAIGAVVVGLIVWLFGGKLIKPAFVLIGGVIGSALGAVYTPMLTPTIAGIPAAYPGMAAGLIVGMLAAGLVYRFAMASLAAGVGGSAAVLACVVTLSYFPGAIPPTDAVTQKDGRAVITADGTDTDLRQQVESQVRDWSGRLKDAAQKYKDASVLAQAGAPPAPGATPAGLDDADKERIEAAKRTAQAISDHIAERWQALPARTRLIIAGSWMAGAMGGFLLGLLLPSKAAAAVSSLAGAAMLLAGATSLADHYTTLGPQISGVSAMGWLGAWMALSAIGLFFQSRGKKRPAPAAEAPPR